VRSFGSSVAVLQGSRRRSPTRARHPPYHLAAPFLTPTAGAPSARLSLSPCVAYVCFKCFRRFRCMLHLLHMNVAKVDRGCCICCNCFRGMLQAYVSSVLDVSEVCFIRVSKRMLQMCLSGCCICFTHTLHAFYLDVCVWL
jgi:hypothetical protein